jgi:hypothetical protein
MKDFTRYKGESNYAGKRYTISEKIYIIHTYFLYISTDNPYISLNFFYWRNEVKIQIRLSPGSPKKRY